MAKKRRKTGYELTLENEARGLHGTNRALLAEVRSLETSLIGRTNAFGHASDRCATLTKQLEDVTRERDNLAKDNDTLSIRVGSWRALALSTGTKLDRMRRHRELLLDVMTASEDAGTDYSALHVSEHLPTDQHGRTTLPPIPEGQTYQVRNRV